MKLWATQNSKQRTYEDNSEKFLCLNPKHKRGMDQIVKDFAGIGSKDGRRDHPDHHHHDHSDDLRVTKWVGGGWYRLS